jgi:inorganic pyrophosphatase
MSDRLDLDLAAGEPGFWDLADRFVAGHRLVIDRPRGSRHPRFPDFVYPIDYGFLDGTSAADGGGIDVWRGSGGMRLVGVFVTLDGAKRDAEVKFVVGCDAVEIAAIAATLDGPMRGVFVPRPLASARAGQVSPSGL